MQFIYIILIVFAVWLLGLTVLGLYIFNFFKRLTRGVGEGNMINVLGKLLEDQALTRKEFGELKKDILRIEDASKVYIQKLGFVRFNPFEELGGDHSFSVALLDARDSGILITGLHTRERTRVYVKNIKRGKPEVGLSLEEKQALKLAHRK